MKYKTILLISAFIIIITPLANIFFIYPSFVNLVIKSAEEEAIKVAGYLSKSIDMERIDEKEYFHHLSGYYEEIREEFDMAKIKIFSADGEVVFSSDPLDIGKVNKKNYFHEYVARGNVYAKTIQKEKKSLEDQIVKSDVVETYIPIMSGGEFKGAFEIYYDITKRKKQIEKLSFYVSLMFFTIGLSSFIIILLIFLKNKSQLLHLGDFGLSRLKAFQLLTLLLISIFTIEFGIMIVMDYFVPPMHTLIAGLSDSLILILALYPILYLLFFKPLMGQIKSLEKSESRLRDSEERFKFIVQFIPDIIYMIDDKGRFTFLNNSIRKLGFEPKELIGRHFSKIISSNDIDHVSRDKVLQKYRGKSTGNENAPQLFDERRSAERATKELEVKVKYKDSGLAGEGAIESDDGKVMIASVNSCGLYNEDDDTAEKVFKGTMGVITKMDNVFLGTTGVIKDITKQKMTQRALFDSEDRYHALMDCASDAILLVDEEGNITEYNRMASQLLGGVENLRGIDIRRIHPDGEHKNVDKMFDDILYTGRGSLNDTVVFGADGALLPVDITGSLIELSEQKKIVQEIIRDISERKRAERDLKDKEQLLIQQSKLASMGEMISAIAHQWRQPLTSLGLIIQDTLDAYDYKELDREYLAGLVDGSMKQIKLMSDVIDSFKDFFKPSKGVVTFNVSKVVKEAMSFLSSQLSNDNIRWEIKGIVSEGVSIKSYQNEFMQVMFNLINNARDAVLTRRSDSADKIGEIVITFEKEGNYVKLSVCDNGGGIPENLLEKIFEPYFTTKDEGKGTGIGLYMSKIIVETHMKGELRVENIDNGAMFVLKLPETL